VRLPAGSGRNGGLLRFPDLILKGDQLHDFIVVKVFFVNPHLNIHEIIYN